jgi:hypothetical protein
MLNESGDTTIVWTSDRDDEMEKIIEEKMAAGCIFFIIDPRFGTREPLKHAGDALRNRMLAIPDESFAAFVSARAPDDGGTVRAPTVTATAVKTPDKPARVSRKAKTAKEVATNESIGMRQRGGG